MKHKTKSFGKEKDYCCELSILYYILFRVLCSLSVLSLPKGSFSSPPLT